MLEINQLTRVLLLGALLTTFAACEEVASVSILKETEDFVQASSEIDNKIDILWIVDNSGSMHDEQTALAANFDAFIQDLEIKGYDFQIAITTTDAYIAGREEFKTSTNGVTIFTPQTPNLRDEFNDTIMVGTGGSGWERGMQSMEAAFNNANNQTLNFPREEAFLSVIVVSDENDGSRDEFGNYPGMNHYLGFLDSLKLVDTLAGNTRYSINAIVRLPENAGCTSGSNGVRYIELVEETDGIVADVCGDFAQSLSDITVSIVQLSTQFFLSREPIVDSIKVIVSGEIVANDGTNGWTYDASTNSIKFHGSGVPSQGESILIDFDPVSLIN